MIEIFIIKEDEPDKKEFAELFYKCNFKKDIYKLMNIVVCFCENNCVDRNAY